VEPDPSIPELLAVRRHLTMHAMDGLLLEGMPLNAIADAIGTPTWVYAAATIRRRLETLCTALAQTGLEVRVHYAVKANDHLAILNLLGRCGAGADVVSEGELRRALTAGIPASRIVFSGVGKTLDELRLAVTEDIAQINIEGAEELDALSAIAAGMGRTARIALRINPDVDAATHPKITTGRAQDKFGIPYADAAGLYSRAAGLPGIRPIGIAAHIGSQVLSLAPYRAAFDRLASLVCELRAAGLTFERVDCGGGLGIPYRNQTAVTPTALAGALRAGFRNMDVRLILEPGRWIVGPAGVLLASVVLVKHERFVVLDAAMNDLVRPAMYDAWHGIVPLSAAEAARPVAPVDVVGPVCETSDTFARNRLLPPLAPGARVAILDAGAYGAVMSSTYNARPLAAAAMIDQGTWTIIRPRQTVAELWRGERIPEAFA
jgi:diaminopimelate decarboxylase